MKYKDIVENHQLSECIIVVSKFNDKIVLAKNRDRMYAPKIKIVHKILNGVEIAYWEDEETGWLEGLNEFGIGTVNTALRVGFDEKEKEIVKKTGKKSKDSKKFLKILTSNNIEDAIDFAVNYENGIMGHTFIADAEEEKAVRIEASSKHKSIIRKIDLDQITVRTNHGFEYPEAGYTQGLDFKSSKFRKIGAEKILNREDKPKDILNKLAIQNYAKSSQLNMKRTTKKMNTTGQIAIDLSKRVLYFRLFKGLAEFVGIEKEFPKGYKEKIKLIQID